MQAAVLNGRKIGDRQKSGDACVQHSAPCSSVPSVVQVFSQRPLRPLRLKAFEPLTLNRHFDLNRLIATTGQDPVRSRVHFARCSHSTSCPTGCSRPDEPYRPRKTTPSFHRLLFRFRENAPSHTTQFPLRCRQTILTSSRKRDFGENIPPVS